MNDYKFNRIAVKIGSNVLTKSDGMLDVVRIEKIVEQVAELHQNGVEIVLVSSGAVASGKAELKPTRKMDSVELRQLFSAIGQAKLINCYYDLFCQKNIVCGQVLTTKESFGSRRHYLNQQQCMRVMLENNVVPIVNENDTISVTELMFTDNDELSGLIATMMDVDALIILSNIDGIYDGDPNDDSSSVIRSIKPSFNLNQYIQTKKSSLGRGGMMTKTRIARKVAKEGIPVFIANGKKDGILIDLLTKDSTISTFFEPEKKEISSVKKWIAHSEDFAKGKVVVNDGAKTALLKSEAHSLLPVGIIDVKGDFERYDIVKIEDEKGSVLGVGKAEYDSEKIRQLKGKNNQRPFIRYDYLCVEVG